MIKRLILAITICAVASLNASAALVDRGGGLIYDTVLDITWLQDAGTGGSRTWDNAVAWADSLVLGGFDDWRLPSMDVNGDQGPTPSMGSGRRSGYRFSRVRVAHGVGAVHDSGALPTSE